MKARLLVLVLCLAVICNSCSNKKSGVSATATDTLTSAPVTDYKMMIIARLSVKQERIKDFTAAAREMIAQSNKESGCSSYQLYQDPYDNSKFVFVEEYKNQAAVDAHFNTDYFKAFGPKIADLTAGPADIKVISVAKEVKK